MSQILPTTTLDELPPIVLEFITDNALVIVSVLALGIAVNLVLRWFLQSTSFWGGSVGSTVSNYRHRNDW